YEYRTLFDGDPPRNAARVVSTPAEGSASGSPGRSGGGGVAPAAPATDMDMRPASKELGPQVVKEVSEDMAMRQLVSTRPTLTRADRGEWRYVEYVTTGRTPLLLKAVEMERYGFASGRVNTDEELERFFGAQRLVRL